jgi:hypothetical protein
MLEVERRASRSQNNIVFLAEMGQTPHLIPKFFFGKFR